jgi:hypothetical protein
MRIYNFLRLIHNKVTSRSYNYFVNFSYFSFLRNWFFQLCQKLQSLVKKTEGILGVKGTAMGVATLKSQQNSINFLFLFVQLAHFRVMSSLLANSWLLKTLTPKIPSVFLFNSCSFWPSWRNPFLYPKKVRELEEVTVGSWSYLVEHQPPKITAPHSMGFRRL